MNTNDKSHDVTMKTANLNIILNLSNTLQEIKWQQEQEQKQELFTLTNDDIDAAEIESLLAQFDEKRK